MTPSDVAILVPATGIPRSLASTAFTCALAEGLAQRGVRATLVGAITDPSLWDPEMLPDDLEAQAPFLGAPVSHPSELSTELDATLDTLFQDASAPMLMVYIRALPWLDMASEIGARRGWKVIVFSTEELTSTHLPPRDLDEYVRIVGERATGVWVVSERLRQWWTDRGVAPDRIILAPSMIRSTSFEHPSATVAPGLATYVGNLVHEEIDRLLDITEEVRRSHPNFRLRMIGDAIPERRAELDTILEERGLSGSIEIIGPVTPAAIPGYLAESAILLLPRARGVFSQAGFPNKLGEYLASGRPVITTSVGDIPEYLEDGVHAILVDPDDVGAFAHALMEPLDDPERQSALGAAGRERFRAIASNDLVVGRALAWISELQACDHKPQSSGLRGLFRRMIGKDSR